MKIGTSLKNARVEAELTQAQLAEKIGVKHNTVSDWENERTSPSPEQIAAVCQTLQISADVLLGTLYINEQLTAFEQSHIKKYRTLDDHGKEVVDVVLDKEAQRMKKFHSETNKDEADTRIMRLYRTPAAAGAGNAISGEDYDEIVVSAEQKGDFAVRISGDSMEPYIKDGGIAFIDESGKHNIKDGDVGIFEYDGNYYCKQFHKEYTGTILYSVNRRRADLDVFINTHGNLSFSCKGRVILPHRIPLPISARL